VNAVPCCPCLSQLVMSCLVPGRRFYTPSWPKWPKKVWLQTAQPGNKIGLEMDDGSPRPGKDRFDVDGTDDDSEVGGRVGGRVGAAAAAPQPAHSLHHQQYWLAGTRAFRPRHSYLPSAHTHTHNAMHASTPPPANGLCSRPRCGSCLASCLFMLLQLVHRSTNMNLKCGRGLLHVLDDVRSSSSGTSSGSTSGSTSGSSSGSGCGISS
jgi:hypothetical protein